MKSHYRDDDHLSKSISTYTVLCILRQIKFQMGLEAMLEYLEAYLEGIEAGNPKLRGAVQQAICMMNIERIYTNAVK